MIDLTEGQTRGSRGAHEPVVRFASADASAILQRLEAMPLAATGKLSAISLGAIAARLGRKWQFRRELVVDYLERTLHGRLGPAAIVLKLSDTEILVAQPDATRLAGQMAVLNSLRETLHHFLGEALIGDMIVHQVTRITRNDIYGEQLDVPAVEAGAAEEQRQARKRAAERPAGAWSPFLASDGRTLQISCRLEPVIQLKTSSRIGHRVAREVFVVGRDIPLSNEEVQQLPRADLERIDYAGVERAIARLKSSGDRDPSLIIPLSLTTLSSTRARGILRGLLTEAHQSVQHGVICEICDIEGAPLSALADAIAFVRPFSLYVTGRVSDRCTGGRLQVLKGIGLAGLSVECPASIRGDAEFIGWMKSCSATLKAIGKAAIVYRLPSMRNAAMASVLGLTHGSFRRSDDDRQVVLLEQADDARHAQSLLVSRAPPAGCC